MLKRKFPRRLFNIHFRLLLAQAILFGILEVTRESMPTYWMITLVLLGGFGVILFPYLASRSVQRGEREFQHRISPGSEILQIGTCALLFFIHFDVPLGLHVIAGAGVLLGIVLMRRQWSTPPKETSSHSPSLL